MESAPIKEKEVKALVLTVQQHKNLAKHMRLAQATSGQEQAAHIAKFKKLLDRYKLSS